MSKSFKLRNGSHLLSTEAPGGIYNSAQLKRIAELTEDGAAIIKATEDQRLALFVAEDKVASVSDSLKELGLEVRNYQDGLHQPTACIGQLCEQSEQDALASAMDISKALASMTLDQPLKIGINGCASCCVPCHTLDVAIIGDSSGYRVSLGGKNSQIPEMASFIAEGVPAAELVGMVQKTVEIYKINATEGESLQALIERIGSGSFVEAFAPYSRDAASGSSDPFAVPQPEASETGAPVEAASDESPALDVAEEMPEAELLGESFEAEATGEEAFVEEAPSEEFATIEDSSIGDMAPSIAVDSTAAELDINPQDFSASSGMADVLIMDSGNDLVEDAPAEELQPELIQARAIEAEAIEALARSQSASAAETNEEQVAALASETQEMPATDAEQDAALSLVTDVQSFDEDTAIDAAEDAVPELDDESALENEVDFASDVDEGELESKLTQAIEEEQKFVAPDASEENTADRDAAVSMVEAAKNAQTQDDLAINDNGEIDVNLEEFADLGGESFEEASREEDTSDGSSDAPAAPRRISSVPSKGGWSFRGIQMLDNQRIAFNFASGASVVIDAESLNVGESTQTLTLDAIELHITREQNGLRVDIEGLEFFLPTSKAA